MNEKAIDTLIELMEDFTTKTIGLFVISLIASLIGIAGLVVCLLNSVWLPAGILTGLLLISFIILLSKYRSVWGIVHVLSTTWALYLQYADKYNKAEAELKPTKEANARFTYLFGKFKEEFELLDILKKSDTFKELDTHVKDYMKVETT